MRDLSRFTQDSVGSFRVSKGFRGILLGLDAILRDLSSFGRDSVGSFGLWKGFYGILLGLNGILWGLDGGFLGFLAFLGDF